MTNDTLKSLGYLKKSLKMSNRAVSKNRVADQDDTTILEGMIDAMIVETERLEGISIPVASTIPVVPVPVVVTDTSDTDLLTT